MRLMTGIRLDQGAAESVPSATMLRRLKGLRVSRFFPRGQVYRELIAWSQHGKGERGDLAVQLVNLGVVLLDQGQLSSALEVINRLVS
jgi:hypothetical protein